MKILFITYNYLDGNGGGVFASRAFINAFAEIANEITLVFPDNSFDIKKELNKKIEYFGISNKKSIVTKVIRLLRGKIHKFDFKTLKKSILDKRKFDLIVFDTCMMGDLTKKMKSLGYKTITIHHNVQIDYYKDNNRSLLLHVLGLFGYWLKRNEKYALLYSDINLTLTQSDAQNLPLRYNILQSVKIQCIGCFEYKTYQLPKVDINTSDRITFIITGNLGSVQSNESLIPFLKIYLPVMRSVSESFKLIIAGQNPSKPLSDLCKRFDSIELIPNPVDMYPIISRADIYICPTFLGSGIKLRVMDGLKMGLPIITHTCSARGYEMFQTAGCLFSYSDIVTFRSALKQGLELNKDINRKKIIDLYQKNFSFSSGVERIREILE